MWIVRMGIGCAHNFAEQNERGIGEIVFFQDRIERNVFAVMTELTLRHVEYDTVVDLALSRRHLVRRPVEPEV